MNELNLFKLILEAGFVVKVVILILISLSVISWGIIFLKIRLLKRSKQNSEDFVEHFWGQNNLESAYRRADDLCPRLPCGQCVSLRLLRMV